MKNITINVVQGGRNDSSIKAKIESEEDEWEAEWNAAEDDEWLDDEWLDEEV